MLETVQKISSIVVSTVGIWGPGLLIVLMYAIPKIWPKSDSYFRKAYLTLNEVDDITDAILHEFPDLAYIKTADDMVNKALSILEKRYDVDDQQKEQVSERVKANLKKEEGLSVNWKDGVGTIEVTKDF